MRNQNSQIPRVELPPPDKSQTWDDGSGVLVPIVAGGWSSPYVITMLGTSFRSLAIYPEKHLLAIPQVTLGAPFE